jgi:hypothetical protein
MNNNRGSLFAQAVRGPVLLITVGVLFAMHQAQVISFARSWPLILIVVGIMKLLERMYVPYVPQAAPPPPQERPQ